MILKTPGRFLGTWQQKPAEIWLERNSTVIYNNGSNASMEKNFIIVTEKCTSKYGSASRESLAGYDALPQFRTQANKSSWDFSGHKKSRILLWFELSKWKSQALPICTLCERHCQLQGYCDDVMGLFLWNTLPVCCHELFNPHLRCLRPQPEKKSRSRASLKRRSWGNTRRSFLYDVSLKKLCVRLPGLRPRRVVKIHNRV